MVSEIKHKRGDVRTDGLVCWKVDPRYRGGVWWVTPEHFARLVENRRAKGRIAYWSDPEDYRARKRASLARTHDAVIARNNKYSANKRRTDKRWAAEMSLRTRVGIAIREHGAAKNENTWSMMGCTRDCFLKYVESKFLPGMSWENYGLHGWHLDHIRPCASFDLTDPAQQLLCFHYTNLQPLWADDNWAKGAKLTECAS